MENSKQGGLPKSLKELSLSLVKFIETVDQDKTKKTLNQQNKLKNKSSLDDKVVSR